ncbi:MAG: thioredoxin family protein [Chitinophagaceae bacterium]|nr:MAG: thioredoxin family protein [Chitinophagaceae bacterium]
MQKCLPFTKPPEQIWIRYTGHIGVSFEWRVYTSNYFMKTFYKSRLKIIAMIMALFFVAFTGVGQVPENADKIISDARLVATKENKNIFVIFHASWCGWCHKMDTAMNDPQVKRYFDDNYVIRHLVVLESKNKKNLENPGALELMKMHSEESSGIPFWIVLDQQGKKIFDSREKRPDGTIGDNVGCPASESEVNHFISVLKGSSKINESGLQAIRTRFRRIETVR